MYMDFIFCKHDFPTPISLGGAGNISMISMLKYWKQLQAIDSVCLTLVLMPVGKASGIPIGVILKGSVCEWVCVCACACVHVHMFMQPHVYYNKKPFLILWLYAHWQLSAAICFFVKCHTTVIYHKRSQQINCWRTKNLYTTECKLDQCTFIFNCSVDP